MHRYYKIHDALNHFTIVNDGNRRVRLYNFDLLHALTKNIIIHLEAGDEDDVSAAEEIKQLWVNIREDIYFDNVETTAIDGLKEADNFLASFPSVYW